MKQGLELLSKENLTVQDSIVWAAYHLASQPIETDPPALSALLPLFYEKAALCKILARSIQIGQKHQNLHEDSLEGTYQY